MKRMLILLMMVAIFCPVVAEEGCLHRKQTEIVTSYCALTPDNTGHFMCDIKRIYCVDCDWMVEYKQYGDLKGHTFHLAESIHSSEEKRHLWVFLCSGCMHVTMIEENCIEGENCMRYSAQAGRQPKVQYLDSIAAWKETNAKSDIVNRWLNWDYNLIWIAENEER